MATLDMDFKFYKVAYRREGAKEFLLPGAEGEEVKQLNDVMKRLEEAVTRFKQSKKKSKEETQRNVVELLNQITYLFKAAEYEYEHEIRLVIDTPIGFDMVVSKAEESPRVYIEIGDIRPLITKLTLGPKVERADEWASVFYYSFKELYDKTRSDEPYPDIYISHLPFK
jgi:hypothetical protein